MKNLSLDATNWKTQDDFYEAFFKAVGSPSWHGRNFNALRDSIAAGRINEVELPYTIHISGLKKVPPEVRKIAKDFRDLIRELHSEGYEVGFVGHVD
jgi:RNAse (barnase) inhibitor barstar